jgi:hypothetical protein
MPLTVCADARAEPASIATPTKVAAIPAFFMINFSSLRLVLVHSRARLLRCLSLQDCD